MITGRNNILEWFKSLPSDDKKELRYWTIYPKGKTSDGWFVQKSPQDEGLTLTDSLTALQKALGLIGHGQYTIVASWATSSVGKGGYKEDVEISPLENTNSTAAVGSVQQPVNMAGYMTKDEAMNMAKDMFKQMTTEKELEDSKKLIAELQKENKELSKNTDGIGRIVEMVAPYAPLILGKVFPGAQPLAQVGTLDVQENQPHIVNADAEAQGNRLVDLLEKCGVVFGVDDSIDFLEKLMNVVEVNPHLVPMIKSMVK